jgi:hypothetical protein
MEPYYNLTYGQGFEGFINYANLLVEGWLSILFLAAIFIIVIIVLMKSEWNTPSVFAFASFICLISAFILKLFTVVNAVVMFAIFLALGISIIWGVINKYGN